VIHTNFLWGASQAQNVFLQWASFIGLAQINSETLETPQIEVFPRNTYRIVEVILSAHMHRFEENDFGHTLWD
jgi:hypothetical protein